MSPMREREARVARVPLDAPAATLSGTLVLDPMGWLSVEVTFLNVPVDHLDVRFCQVGADGPGDPVSDSQAPDKDQLQQSKAGRARLSFMVPVGNYLCQIERQPPALVTTVEDPEKPFLLALPIGRPVFDLQGDFPPPPKASGGAAAQNKQGAHQDAQEHYRPKDASIHIPEGVKPRLKQIADAYHAETGKDITVTSGTRTPEQQASAMHHKMVTDGTQAVHDLYKQKSLVDEIIKSYTDNAEKSGAEQRQAMTQTIQTQIDGGHYVSPHLRANALDIRSKDMSADEQAAFKKAAAEAGAQVVDETDSQAGAHFHLQNLQ